MNLHIRARRAAASSSGGGLNPLGTSMVRDLVYHFSTASLTECNVRANALDGDSATLLAKVAREKRVMLFGIKHDQTVANFISQGLGPEDAILIASDLAVSASMTVTDMRYNKLDTESATMLATIAKEKGISLCGITPEQTVADFSRKLPSDPIMHPADAILLTADLAVRASLTSVRSPAHKLAPFA